MNFVAAILYAVAISVLLAIGFGFQNAGLDARTAVLALCGGGAVGTLALWRTRKEQSRLARPRGWQWVPVALFALFALRAFLWLIFRHQDELRVLSPNNLGDMSLHVTYIRYFANGAPFWPDNPIFAGGKLTYAIGTDLFNSLLVLAGLDLVRGLVWVGLIGAILSGFALWRWGGAFALMGFLCSGGLLGFTAFFAGPDEPFFQDYAGNLKFDWAWKSLPLALLVTQRGFLFALPAGLLLLSSWRTRFFGGSDGWRLPLWGEWLLYAAMPIFHLHTFLVLSFLLGAFFLGHAAARKKIALLVGTAFVPATILVYLAIGMFRGNAEPMWGDMGQIENPPGRPPAEVLGWQPGWMVNDPLDHFDPWELLAGNSASAQPFAAHGRFLFFWLGNFGLLPFVAGTLAIVLLRQIGQRSWPRRWTWSAVLLFIFITPLLGQSASYQRDTISRFLLGTGQTSLFWNITAGLLAVAAFIVGVALHLRKSRASGLRWVLFGFAGLFFLDAVLASLHTEYPRVPLLRVNAIPLLFATLLFIRLLVKLARRRDPTLWPAAFVFPALFLFFLCCNVMFAPWAWDNTKMMIWAYLIVLPFIWEYVLARWRWWTRAVAIFVLFFSGFTGLLGGISNRPEGYPMARLSELDAVGEAVKRIPITATFAASPNYDHPLLLNGRKLVLGWPGHVESHGLQCRTQEDKLRKLMNGAPDWRIAAAELDARYLFFGPREKEQWPASRAAWRDGAQIIASGDWGGLFDLDLPPVPVEP